MSSFGKTWWILAFVWSLGAVTLGYCAVPTENDLRTRLSDWQKAGRLTEFARKHSLDLLALLDLDPNKLTFIPPDKLRWTCKVKADASFSLAHRASRERVEKGSR